jgi:hypothetical protein
MAVLVGLLLEKVAMVVILFSPQLRLLGVVVEAVINQTTLETMVVAVVVAVLYLELVVLVTRQPLLLMEAMERHLIHNKEEVVAMVAMAVETTI